MVLVPILSRKGWELQVAQLPDRKKKALILSQPDFPTIYVLGYFNTERHAEMFNEFIGGELDAKAMERIWKR